MRIGKRLFPYPILNNEILYSQYKNSTFAFDYIEEITDSEYIIRDIKCTLTNNSLIELIDSNKASIYCVVECANTMFRKTFKLNLNICSIRIPLRDLNGKVSICAFVVANEDIDNYYSEDFLDDYMDYTFMIEKNDILAVDDGYTNKIDFNEDEDTKKSSIFVIIKDLTIKNGTMLIEYDSSKITISLPEDEWNMYDKTKKLKMFENIYFSIIAIPALSYCLSSLQNRGDFSIDMLRMDYKWFNSFCIQYNNIHGKELIEEDFLQMNVNTEAQLMMNTPVTKSLVDIFGFTMKNFGGNEYGD